MLDRIGVEDHARPLPQLAADHLVFRSGIAGDLDDGDARDVDIVLDVCRTGLKVDRRGNDAALKVADLEMELVLIELLDRFIIGVAHGVGVDAARLQRKVRENEGRRKQGVAADDNVLDDQSLLNDQRERAGLRVEIDVLDVGRHLSAVTDALVVIIDLQHVLPKGIRVKDLAHRKIHQRQQGIAGDFIVSGKDDLRNDGILDDAVRDRDAAGSLAHQRRGNVREVSERVDAREVFLHDLRVVWLPRACRDDTHDRLRRHVKVAGYVDRDDLRRGGRPDRRTDAQIDRHEKRQDRRAPL